jgi:hypothetical protein
MNINMLHNFMQVLNSIRKHPPKNEYFHKYILFTTIYSLQELKLNNRNYSKQELNMFHFVKSTEHDVHMHGKFGGLYFYRFLQLNTPRFDL